MIEFEEALEIILSSETKPKTKQIPFEESLHKILAQDVFSDIDMPPFNKSAMDGFACRREDLQQELEMIEIIPAGQMPKKTVGKNQCSKIMTGSMVPPGADCVIMVEHTDETSDNKIKFTAENTKRNFVLKCDDVKIGDLVLRKGTLVKPQHIAVMASVGCTDPSVFVAPKVGVLSTGNELVEPAIVPSESKIRNSNSYQIMAQIQNMGCTAKYFGIVQDSEEHSIEMIEKALSECDVVLLSGGVSMGDFDFIPAAFQKLGIDIKFEKIAVQPGKPTVFGTKDQKFVYGLPGNPVSSFTIFELLVKPLLYKISGHDFKVLPLKLEMGGDYKRKRSVRKSFLPIGINDEGKVIPLDYHGSAHVHALVEADGLIGIPIGKTELKKGELVDVRQI
jgi:molybdopterin molybdotransferase